MKAPTARRPPRRRTSPRARKDLTLPEGAPLAGLLQSPSRLDPYDNPKARAIARRRRSSAACSATATSRRPQYDAGRRRRRSCSSAQRSRSDGIYAAPYFVAHVKKLLQQQFTGGVVFKGGLTVYTTLDTRMQKLRREGGAAQVQARERTRGRARLHRPAQRLRQGARRRTDYTKSKFNLATQGYRQPGSSFKTFVLVTRLTQGMPPSLRRRFVLACRDPRQAQAVDRRATARAMASGMMSLETATGSVNTVFARVAYEIGIKNVAATAKPMGIKTKLPNYPSIALGAAN